MPDFCSYFKIEVEKDITLTLKEKGGYRTWDRWQEKITSESVYQKNYPGKLLDGKNGSSKGSDGWIQYTSGEGVLFTFRGLCPVGKHHPNSGSFKIENDPDNIYKVDAYYNASSSETEGFETTMPGGGHPIHCKFIVSKNGYKKV